MINFLFAAFLFVLRVHTWLSFWKASKSFLDFACQQPQYLNDCEIGCPCKLCKYESFLTPKIVNVHIRQKGFTPGY